MSLEDNKVYFPVESLTGLGHFNRTGKLVREMVKAGMGVTVASGSFVDPQRFFAGADCREVPQIAFKSDGNFYILKADGTRTIQPEFNEVARKDERLQAHLDNVQSLHPNVVITEFWPFDRPGVDQEMKAVLEESKEAVKRGLRLVSVRDVLDTPYDIDKKKDPGVEQRHAERQAWAIQMINENFDAVLVHGDPNFIPLSETCPAAADIKVPVIYTGYVIDELPKRTVRPGDMEAPIVVSCGSGVDGHELVYSFLTAWQRLVESKDKSPEMANMLNHPVHIVCGPRFDPQAFTQVKDWAEYLENDYGVNIKVDAYRDDFTSLLANAAFSVSLAGYNTTLETLAMEVPALLVPKYGFVHGNLRFSTEQLYRLERLHEKGLASLAHPYEVQDPRQFSELLLQEFTEQTKGDKQRPKLNFNGATNTVAAMDELLSKKNAPAAFPAAMKYSSPKVPA
ncbi:MAG: glycosyltransferase family protein [Alphaproteobacteria bacterium]